jgi:hypothetical protein
MAKESAYTRRGWSITPLRRIIKSMKMMPLGRLDVSVGKQMGNKKKKTRLESELRVES